MHSQYDVIVSLINQTTTDAVKEAETQLNNLQQLNTI